jgi:hypothetical protein
MGLLMRQLLATPCVTLSLALVARGSSDPTGGFHLQTVTSGRPHVNRGTRFGYGCHIPQCQMMPKLIFTAPFYHACGAQSLCLLCYYTVGL